MCQNKCKHKWMKINKETNLQGQHVKVNDKYLCKQCGFGLSNELISDVLKQNDSYIVTILKYKSKKGE